MFTKASITPHELYDRELHDARETFSQHRVVRFMLAGMPDKHFLELLLIYFNTLEAVS